MAWEGGINPGVERFPKAQGCLMPMGVTSENVAAAFGVSRWAVPWCRLPVYMLQSGTCVQGAWLFLTAKALHIRLQL
jgi:hypothetical protein